MDWDTDPLVVLLLLDLVHLLHQLSHSELQLCQLVFGGDLGVVVGVFTDLDVQVNSLQHDIITPTSGQTAVC